MAPAFSLVVTLLQTIHVSCYNEALTARIKSILLLVFKCLYAEGVTSKQSGVQYITVDQCMKHLPLQNKTRKILSCKYEWCTKAIHSDDKSDSNNAIKNRETTSFIIFGILSKTRGTSSQGLTVICCVNLLYTCTLVDRVPLCKKITLENALYGFQCVLLLP